MICRIVFVTLHKFPATEYAETEFEATKQRVKTVQYAGIVGVLVNMLDVNGWGRRISIHHGVDACFIRNQ